MKALFHPSNPKIYDLDVQITSGKFLLISLFEMNFPYLLDNIQFSTFLFVVQADLGTTPSVAPMHQKTFLHFLPKKIVPRDSSRSKVMPS